MVRIANSKICSSPNDRAPALATKSADDRLIQQMADARIRCLDNWYHCLDGGTGSDVWLNKAAIRATRGIGTFGLCPVIWLHSESSCLAPTPKSESRDLHAISEAPCVRQNGFFSKSSFERHVIAAAAMPDLSLHAANLLLFENMTQKGSFTQARFNTPKIASMWSRM